MNYRLFHAPLFGLLAFLFVAAPFTNTVSASDRLRINAVNVYAPLPRTVNSDVQPFVFVETTPGATTVRRAQTGDNPELPLFGVASSEASHVLIDPFNGSETFQKGVALGIELGDWLTAQGTIKMTCIIKGDTTRTTLTNKFRHLVSKGRYSLWGVADTSATSFANPEALGNFGADASSFKASRAGNGSLTAKIDFCPSTLTGESLKVLLFYQFDPKASITTPPIPGVNGAYQLTRVLQ